MKEKIQVRFGKVVKEQRSKTGQSQEKFAEIVGVHRTYVGMVERGEKNITISNIEKIANALNVTIAQLFEKI